MDNNGKEPTTLHFMVAEPWLRYHHGSGAAAPPPPVAGTQAPPRLHVVPAGLALPGARWKAHSHHSTPVTVMWGLEPRPEHRTGVRGTMCPSHLRCCRRSPTLYCQNKATDTRRNQDPTNCVGLWCTAAPGRGGTSMRTRSRIGMYSFCCDCGR